MKKILSMITSLVAIILITTTYAHNDPTIIFKKVFQGNTTVLGQKMRYPGTDTPQIVLWKVILPAKSAGAWHQHFVPEFFYVVQGKLFVTNKQKNGQLDVTVFNKGQVGLTDINIPQFIWNPGKDQVTVIAVYLGIKGKEPTQKLGKQPDKQVLTKLLSEKLTENKTEMNNEVLISN